ncbi:hypothetical protein MLD38_001193 [Melastoma candidum]|uniref:Uncharacterized protein n=1 Tax=Melastoma candidum TaxID=119954 RepID=A0ACB9SBX1_9MYRT|nr:hypothetical protein MLD38_001193 [Melastoma candidum]
MRPGFRSDPKRKLMIVVPHLLTYVPLWDEDSQSSYVLFRVNQILSEAPREHAYHRERFGINLLVGTTYLAGSSSSVIVHDHNFPSKTAAATRQLLKTAPPSFSSFKDRGPQEEREVDIFCRADISGSSEGVQAGPDYESDLGGGNPNRSPSLGDAEGR